MGFSDFWIQNGNGKEQLKDTKHGVRKEQVDKKFQNLFDAYDANSDGTLEDTELQQIFGHLKNLSGDNVLDASENKRAASIFAKQVGIQDADFQGFVKSISDASEDILSSEETATDDGGKEIKTKYKDGTTETIAYYPNGDFKWKKIEKRFHETTYEIEINGQRQQLNEEQYKQALKKLDEMEAQQKAQQKPKRQFGLENDRHTVSLAPQFSNNISVRSNTTEREEHDQKFSPRFIAEALGVDINSEDGKKVLERMSYLPKEALDQIKDGAELKDVLSSNELTLSFDNISNVLELMYGVTLRNEEEYEASKPQREKIVQQIQTVGIMSELYSRVAEFYDNYTDNQGLFGMGSEGIQYILNKTLGNIDFFKKHGCGENHYQWADSCREFIEKINDFKVLNPTKFEQEFKELTGKEKFNVDALQKMVELAKDGKAQNENGDYTDEYKQAVKDFSNFDVTNINAKAWYHPENLLNGFGEALIMIMTLGWGAETKAGQMLATSTMATFGKAGVTIASKQVNNRLLQGALRLSGKGVKLLAPMINEGTKMYLYTAVTGTATNVANRTIKFDSEENSIDKFLQTEAMVLDSATGSFGFGAFAGAFGSTVTQKVMQRASRVSQKVGTALSDKFAKGAVDANEVFTTILEKSAPTKIAEAAAYATDVLGFTAFESVMTLVNHMDGFPDNVTFEDVTKLLWEEFKGQGVNLGQIKGISYLIMWMSGSRSARMQASKYMRENPQFKGTTVEKAGEGFKINLPDGRKVECKNTTEMISSLLLMSRGETAFGKNFNVSQKADVKATTPKADVKISLGDENRVVSTTGVSGLANRAVSDNYAYSTERVELTQKLADNNSVSQANSASVVEGVKLSNTEVGQKTFEDMFNYLRDNHVSYDLYTLPDGRRLIKISDDTKALTTKDRFTYIEYDSKGNCINAKASISENSAKTEFNDFASVKPRFLSNKTQTLNMGVNPKPIAEGLHAHKTLNAINEQLANVTVNETETVKANNTFRQHAQTDPNVLLTTPFPESYDVASFKEWADARGLVMTESKGKVEITNPKNGNVVRIIEADKNAPNNVKSDKIITEEDSISRYSDGEVEVKFRGVRYNKNKYSSFASWSGGGRKNALDCPIDAFLRLEYEQYYKNKSKEDFIREYNEFIENEPFDKHTDRKIKIDAFNNALRAHGFNIKFGQKIELDTKSIDRTNLTQVTAAKPQDVMKPTTVKSLEGDMPNVEMARTDVDGHPYGTYKQLAQDIRRGKLVANESDPNSARFIELVKAGKDAEAQALLKQASLKPATSLSAAPKITIDSPEFQAIKTELTDLYKKKKLTDEEKVRVTELEAEVQKQGILVAKSPLIEQIKISMLAKAEPREAFLPDFSNEAQLKEMGFTKKEDGKWYHSNSDWYPDALSDKDVVYVFKRDASGKPIDTGFGPKDELPSLYVRSEDFDNNNMRFVQPSEMKPGQIISVKKCASGTFCILPVGTKIFTSEGIVEVKPGEIVNVKEAKNSVHTSRMSDVPDMYKADPLNPASKELFDLINEYKAKEPTMTETEQIQFQARISDAFSRVNRGQKLIEILGTGETAPKTLRDEYDVAARISKAIDEKYLSRIDCSNFDKGLEEAGRVMDEILADKTLNAAQKQAAIMGVMTHMVTTTNLHQHGKGSTPKDVTLALAREKGLPESTIADIEAAYAQADKGYPVLSEFNKAYDVIGQVIRTPEDYKASINGIIRESMKRGQLICEIRCACDSLRDAATGKSLTPREGTLAIMKAIEEVKAEIRAEGLEPPETSFVFLTFRGKGWDGSLPMAVTQAKEAVRAAEENPNMKFGYDVAGPEDTGWGPKAFKEAMDIINQHNEDVKAGRKKGNTIGITMHAGETPTYEGGKGYKSVLDAIEMGAVRIGHGIQLAKYLKEMERTNPEEFNRVLNLVKEKGITIEICGVCNIQSIPINSEGMEQHAIQTFLDYGIPVTICTDNDAICGTNISKEYTQFLLTGHSNFMDWNAIKQSVRDGVDAAFITDAQKIKVRAELETRLAKVQKLYDNAMARAERAQAYQTIELRNRQNKPAPIVPTQASINAAKLNASNAHLTSKGVDFYNSLSPNQKAIVDKYNIPHDNISAIHGVLRLKLTKYDTPEIIERRYIESIREKNLDPNEISDEVLRDVKQIIQGKMAGIPAQKKLYIITGRPGSGKSTITRRLGLEDKFYSADSDDLKSSLPGYKENGTAYVHLASAIINDYSLNEAFSRGLNTLVQTTGKQEYVNDIIARAKANGYKDIVIIHSDISIENSMQRAMARNAATGRIVDPEYIEAGGYVDRIMSIYSKPVEGVKQFIIYDNNGTEPVEKKVYNY